MTLENWSNIRITIYLVAEDLEAFCGNLKNLKHNFSMQKPQNFRNKHFMFYPHLDFFDHLIFLGS